MLASVDIFSSMIASGWTIGSAPAHPNLIPDAADRLRNGGRSSSAKSPLAATDGAVGANDAIAPLARPRTAERRVRTFPLVCLMTGFLSSVANLQTCRRKCARRIRVARLDPPLDGSR